MLGKARDIRMVRSVIIAEDQITVRVLIVIAVASLDDRVGLGDERLFCLEKRAIPEP